jgi:hypothetical protein
MFLRRFILYYKYCLKLMSFNINQIRGHRGRNRMVVGFTTTYAISAHHQVSIILYDKVCQWLATGRWFSPISSTNKTAHHDIVEILLKVALNNIKQNI